MLRFSAFAIPLAAFVLACSTRTPLRHLSTIEQRQIGEAAVVEVCGFQLDVESEITRRHREARATAMEYIAIASEAATEGELSKFFTAETLSACGPDAVEWGGVRAAIGRLVDRYGTEAEMLESLEQMSAPNFFCDVALRMEELSRYRGVCEIHYPAGQRATAQ